MSLALPIIVKILLQHLIRAETHGRNVVNSNKTTFARIGRLITTIFNFRLVTSQFFYIVN